MKKTRRWLAMLLAVVLVSSNVIYQLGTNMSASESDSTTEAPQQDDSAEEKAQQEAASNAHKKDSGEAKVQEVNTEEDKNASDTSKKTQVTEKTEKKQEQTAKKADTAKKANAAKKADASSGDTKKDSEEKAYKATIQKSKLDGGDIKAWGSDGKKETVAYTDSKYMKEVKEGDSFNFEITVKNSFKLDKVTDQNNNTIQPKKVDGNVYTYKIADVKSDKTFHVLYKEETNSDKSKTDVNKSGDNKKDDADASDDGESDSKANEDKNVSAASEKGKIATVADTDTTQTIRVGQTVTLDSSDQDRYNFYTHNWTVADKNKVRLEANSGVSIEVTGLQEGTTTVTDTYSWGNRQQYTKKYTITVRSAVLPTAIAITGADKVTQFKTINLGYTLTPSNASGKVQWSSSNEQILTVDSNGTVSGLRQGTANVTASVQGSNDTAITATKTIKVVANTQSTDSAIVYYLLDPTKDANSNDSGNWGPAYGTATVNVTNATWTNDKNCFDNVDQRVVSWPNGTNVVTRGSDAWTQIFNNYKSSIQNQLGVTITEDDVEEITLVPAKISRNNGTNPDKHLDCNVNIRCKNVATVKYYLYDAGGTNFNMLGSKNYVINGTSTTKPGDVTSQRFPTTKTVNGVTYTFSGWYTNRELTEAAPAFPAKVTTSITYYAKYVAGYQVMYDLAGGSFSDGSTSATEKHDEGTNVVVRTEPKRKGYTFTGWTVEGLDVSTINSGDNFKMPGNTVKLTANWKAKNIEDYVSLTTKDVTEKYNGQPHQAGQATAVAKAGKDNKDIGNLKIEYQIPGTDTWTTDLSKITATNVSDSTTVKVRVTSDDLLGELTGTEELTITKRDVTLTSASDEKVYDGQPLTNHDVAVSGKDGFVKGEGATYKVTGTITNVGEKTNAFTYKLKENTKEENYNISTKNGTLKVTPVTTEVKVKITGRQNAVTYDGIKHTVTGYDVTEISNELYTADDFTFSGKAEAVGTDAATYPMGLKTSQFENKNANFTNVTFEVVDGSLTINPRQITLKSASDSKAYDKKPLINHNVEIVSGEFVSGEGIDKYNVTGSQTEVGTSDNTFEYTLNDKTKAKNYQITKEPGQLTVTKNAQEIVVTIKENSGKETYDGTEKSVSGYTVESIKRGGENTDVYTEEDFQIKNSAKATVKGKNAGSYDMNLTPDDFENINDRFENVTFVIVDGKLTIEKRKVTLTSADASKEYDGEPLTSNEITVGGEDGFVENEGVTYTVTGAQTAVGSSANSFTYIAKDGTNLDNYDITKTEGTLTVKKNDTLEVNVYITGHTDSKMYNGKEQFVTGYDVRTSTGLYTTNDFTFSKESAKAKGTDAGDYAMGLKTSDFTNTSKNFSKVKFVVTDGNLTITKRDVTLKTADAEKVYDGTALTKDGVTVGGDGFVDGEGATYVVTGSQTTVGSSDNTFTYTLNANTKAGNYEITTEAGTLTVTSNENEVVVQIKGNTKTKKYDGTAKTVSGYEIVSISNSLYRVSDIHFAKTTTEVTKKNAGEYQMGLTAADFSNVNDNFSKVTFVVTDGKLTITKRDVTLTSATDQKVYDGTALTNDEVTVSGDGFAAGEGATYDVTGSQTKVGNSKNNFTIKKLTGNEDNYNFTKVPGTLTVTEQSITPGPDPENPDPPYKGITVDDPSDHVYDGKNHKWNPTVEDVAGKALIEGTDYEVSYDKDNFKDVTTITVTITGKGDYKGTITKKYQITPRPVTLTSATDSKAYDGDPLTNKKVTESKGTDEGFVKGEGASYDVTGSQTEVGTSDNTFTYTLNTNTKKENYTITKVEGKLTVTPDENTVVVTIVGNTVSDTYDGTEKTAAGYKVTDISNTNKKKYTETDIRFSGKAEVKKTDAGSYEMGLKATDFTNGNKNFKNVKFVVKDGKLDIAKREVTMTSASDKKVYDGKALTNKNVTDEGFVEGEGASYDVTGTQTAVGNSKNKFDYKLNDGTKAGNYTITKVEGTLVVTPQSITPDPDPENPDSYKGITINDPSDHIYDGEAHKWAPEVKDKDGNVLKEGTDYEVSYDKDNFTDVSTIKVTIKGKGNYTGTVTKEYKITPRPVTLTSADAKKVYDGKALTKEEVVASRGENEGFVGNDGADYNVTGTQTVVGTSKNTFGYTLKSGTLAKNYAITKVEGTLEVTPVTDKVTVTIQENSGKFTYDGTEKTVKGYEVESISNKLYSKNDFSFSGKDTVKGTDAGTYDMELTAKDFANNNANFSNVEFIIKDGTLKIDKKDVTLTSASATKMYDGKALTKDEVTAEGFVGNDGATYNVTGSQSEVGKSDNTFTYELKKGTNPDNYNIKTVNGELEVTPSDQKVVVTIKENSGKETYDGTEKTVTGYTVENISSKLPYAEKDFEFNGDATVKGTNAGTYNMELKPGDFKNINKNFSNVSFEIIDGTLTIDKRDVTLTSASDSKAYDGTALENKNVTAEGFVGNDGATYNVTGSQTEVGSSDNTFTYELNKGTNKDNYNIKTVNGKLTVTENADEVVVTITEKSGTAKYDGKEHTVKGYDVTNISNKLYTEKDFTFSGDATVKGTNAGTYNMEVKAGDFKNTNKNFSKVKFVIVDGTLTIEKRTVIMTSASQNKVYDGKALTSKKVTVSGEGFAKGEGATYDVTGTRTNTGTSKNTFTYTLKNGTKAANYNIKKVEGKLTITAAAPVTPPNTQNTPANPTPQNRNVVQRVVTSVRNVPSRIAKAVQETGAKVRELVNAGDNNVPLGNQKLDDHKCCVLHFLIMLLTAILYGFFTHNLKKRQKKLFEVREELDTELAKRGLPTTKEQKQQ